MGDRRRFDLFAELIRKNFNPAQYKSIADVAAGKGYLQVALREKGFKEVRSFDLRRKVFHGLDYRRILFDSTIPGKFDLICGMHPDEATDVIIDTAARLRIPFVLCPCCTRSTVTIYWGAKLSFKGWYNHLVRFAKIKGFEVQEIRLHMNGRNDCILGRI